MRGCVFSSPRRRSTHKRRPRKRVFIRRKLTRHRPKPRLLQQVAHLRLIVPVPETYTGSVARGMSAVFHVPARPGRSYTAKVARIPNALDQQSRAMMVELSSRRPSEPLLSHPSTVTPIGRMCGRDRLPARTSLSEAKLPPAKRSSSGLRMRFAKGLHLPNSSNFFSLFSHIVNAKSKRSTRSSNVRLHGVGLSASQLLSYRSNASTLFSGARFSQPARSRSGSVANASTYPRHRYATGVMWRGIFKA